MKELNFTQEDGFYVAEVETNGEPIAIQVNRKYFPYPHDYSLEVLGRIDPSMPWAPVQMFDYESPRNIIVYQNIPVDGYQLKLRSRTEVETACANTSINYFYAKNIGSDTAIVGYAFDMSYRSVPNIEFSSDKKRWERFRFEEVISINYVELAPGETAFFRGFNPLGLGAANDTDLSCFIFKGKFEIGGDLNTLTNKIGGECYLADGHYAKLFLNLSPEEIVGVVSASNLILPKDVSAKYLLMGMFMDNENLTEAPVIDIEPSEVFNGALDYMFAGCTSLSNIMVTFRRWPSENEYYGSSGFFHWLPEVEYGVFNCPSELPIIKDYSHIPAGWKVVYQNVPAFFLPPKDSWPDDLCYYEYIHSSSDDTHFTQLFCPIITKDFSIMSASLKLIFDGNEYEPSEEIRSNAITEEFVESLETEFGYDFSWLYQFANMGYRLVRMVYLDYNMPQLKSGNHTMQVKIGDKYSNEITFLYEKPV